MIKQQLPNFVTLLNLACGVLGIVVLNYGFSNYMPFRLLANNNIAVYLMFAAAFFDFVDGFVARALKVDSPLGKQLDSLADVVTFGVLPGLLSFILINNSLACYHLPTVDLHKGIDALSLTGILFCLPALIMPMLSAFRLAKFNIDTRQSHSFIGLPTPANGLFVASCYYVMSNDSFLSSQCFHPALVSGVVLLFSVLLVAPLPLFAMKFKGFAWKGNEVRFIFLALLVVTVTIAAILGKVMAAVPILVILYILISIINNIATRKTNEV